MQFNWPQTLWIVRHGRSAGNVARDAAEAGGLALIDLAWRDIDVPLSERAPAREGIRHLDRLTKLGIRQKHPELNEQRVHVGKWQWCATAPFSEKQIFTTGLPKDVDPGCAASTF